MPSIRLFDLAQEAPVSVIPIQRIRENLDAVMDSAVGERYRVETTGSVTQLRHYLDTPDWRLRAAGWTVTYRPGPRLLTAARGSVTLEQTLESALPEAVSIAAVATGPVQEAIGGLVGLRALTRVVSASAEIGRADARNTDGKLVARIESVSISRPQSGKGDGAGVLLLTEIEPLRGYESDADKITQALVGSGRFVVGEADEFGVLAQDAGAAPIVAHRTDPRPDDFADHAVAQALSGYLADLTDNVAGTLADTDTEFLHDLRVAVRRIRSLLKRAGDVLPSSLLSDFAGEFRWLGQITTPTRDLDVFLLELPDLAAEVGDPAELDPFAAHLATRRSEALRALRSGLRSARFETLVTDFAARLADITGAPGAAPRVADFAADRLAKAYRRVARQAQALDAESPAEAVHDLRKSGKDFRYLMEVFQPLCDPPTYQLVLKDLKKLQDVLGEFQDGEVQAAALRRFAQEMIDAGEQRADSILVMGALSAHFEAKQRAARAELDSHHADYLGERTAHRVGKLVKR